VDFERYLAARARLVERALAARFPPARARLRQAMRYSLLAGGKRIRPILVHRFEGTLIRCFIEGRS